jgi:hypothetical protein
MKRKPSNLSESLHRQLNSYALAASAAGVSLLALAQPADCRIVYTKVSIEIPPGKTLALDLNHDHRTDFTFSNHSYDGGPFWVSTLKITASGRNGVQSYARVLRTGAQIGPKEKFQRGTLERSEMVTHTFGSCKTSCFTNTSGSWANITNGYLGLRFGIRGKFHYGWARLNVTVQQQGAIHALLTGYAYETIPNKPIIAGKTKGPDVITVQEPTLGALAAGANGLHRWRQK